LGEKTFIWVIDH